MLAIGRALMSNPRRCCSTKPSLAGAAGGPYDLRAIDEIRSKGTTILLVEQNAHAALGHSESRLRFGNRPHRYGRPLERAAADPKIKEAYSVSKATHSRNHVLGTGESPVALIAADMYFAYSTAALFVTSFWLAACNRQEHTSEGPDRTMIKIGYYGDLSGPPSTLVSSAKNGVLMACRGDQPISESTAARLMSL